MDGWMRTDGHLPTGCLEKPRWNLPVGERSPKRASSTRDMLPRISLFARSQCVRPVNALPSRIPIARLLCQSTNGSQRMARAALQPYRCLLAPPSLAGMSASLRHVMQRPTGTQALGRLTLAKPPVKSVLIAQRASLCSKPASRKKAPGPARWTPRWFYQHARNGLRHYWDGSKLLVTDTRVAILFSPSPSLPPHPIPPCSTSPCPKVVQSNLSDHAPRPPPHPTSSRQRHQYQNKPYCIRPHPTLSPHTPPGRSRAAFSGR